MRLEKEVIVMLEKLEVHKCDRCPRVFAHLNDLIKHARYCQDRFMSHVTSSYVLLQKLKTFHCASCTESFDSIRELLLHKGQHACTADKNTRQISSCNINSTPKPYKCPKCEYSFVAKAALEEHSILHLPFPHNCHCGIGFYDAQDLKDHKRLVHNVTRKPLCVKKVQYKLSDEEESPPKYISERPTTKPRLKLKKKNQCHNIPKPDIVIVTVGDKFECPKCKKLYSSRMNLHIHYRIHTGQKPYRCDICNKSFTQQNILTAHQYRHTDEKNHKCPTCNKAFSTEEYLRRHQSIHDDLKLYTCPFCGKGFNDPSACIRHKRIHTRDKRYKCPFCPKAFTDISGLAGHKRRHFNRKISCNICGKKFYVKYELEKHMFVHTKEKSFECDHCHRCYSTKSNLAMHIKYWHTKMKRFNCSFCPKDFPFNCTLKHHIMRRHLNVKRFVCHLCEKGFFAHKEFNSHMSAKHYRVRPEDFSYECDYCGTKFRERSGVFQHIVYRHLQIQCNRCHAKFPTTVDLKRHKLEKPEACEICGKIFFCEGLKDRHIMRGHISKELKVF